MPIKIYIDQGHNPVNPNAGAEGNGLREQDVTYEIGRRLALLLNGNPEFEARVSRPSPETQLGFSAASSLSARVNDANTWGADYFISLHTNASDVPSANGSEAYVFSRQGEAYPFAQSILTYLSYATGIRVRGVFPRPGLYVLRKTEMPATLVELGFITNPSEARLMATDPQSFAQGIYNGILAYFGLL